MTVEIGNFAPRISPDAKARTKTVTNDEAGLEQKP
jgi:hypothetical protein